MEIEELQETWSKLSNEIEQQKKLTKRLIMEMTQQRYSNKFRTISIIETFGAVLCFFTGLYILFNFSKLDTWYLLACGIITVTFLLTMPVLVLMALRRIKNIDMLRNSYRDTFVLYTRAKNYLLMLQKIGIYASLILMVTTSAIFSKIWSDVDFFKVEHDGWLYGVVALATIFIIFFARWGYKCYVNITQSAENIINEFEN